MGLRIVEQILIERRPEDVWAVVADLDTHLAWRPSLVEFRQVTEGQLGVGTRIRQVLDWQRRELVLDDVVSAFEPPRHFGIRGGWAGGDFWLDLVLEPDGSGTLVTFDWPLRPRSLLLCLARPFSRRRGS